MVALLAQIDAYDPVGAVGVTIRLSSHDDERVCHLDGQTWWPAISTLPKLRYDLFDGDFGAAIETPSSSLTAAIDRWPDLPRYAFGDARIRIWTGTPNDLWASWTLRFDGRVTAQPQIANGIASIAFAADDRWLDAPLLATYAGTGGAEGPAGLKGAIKPLALGAPRYLGGVLVDAAKSIIQLSSYGAIEDVEAALDGLARFGASYGDYANYAALETATIPGGQWATSLATGFVRHGAPPYGQTSYMVRGDRAGPDGWSRLPGQLIRRLALLSGGAGKIHDASLNALDVARPYHVSIGLSEQTTARAVIQRLAASVNAVAGVSWLGQLFVVPVGINAPAVTLQADGTALPPVASVAQEEVAAPWWKLAIQADRTWEVHEAAAVQFTEPAEPGATVGSPAGTLVAGTPAEQIVAAIATGEAERVTLNQAITNVNASLDTARADIDAAEAGLAVAQAGLVSAQAAISAVNTYVQVRPNLQVGGNFDRGLTDMAFLPAGAVVEVNNSLWGNIFRHQQDGTNAPRMPPMNVVPGVTYVCSFDSEFFASAGRTRIDVLYFDGYAGTGAASYSADTSGLTLPGTSFSETARQSFQFTVPADRNSIRLRLISEDVAGARQIAWRKIKVERGALPATMWTNEGSANLVYAGIQQVDAARANDFAANASRFVAVESRVTGTEGVANSSYAGFVGLTNTVATDKAAQATINQDLTSRVGATEGVALGAAANYTTLAATIATGNAAQATVNSQIAARLRRGSPNLLGNGAFHDGFSGWSTSGSGWDVILGFSVGPFAQNVGGAVGSFIWRDVSAQAGTAYSLSAEMAPDAAGSMHAYVDWLDGVGAVIDNALSVTGDGWTPSAASPEVAPAGTMKARIRVRRDVAGGAIRITRIQFQEGPATDFDDSATLSDFSAFITENRTAISGVSASLASAQTTLTASVATAQGTANTAISQISNLSQVVTDDRQTAAQQISTLTSSYNGLSATVSVQAATLATHEGKLQAFFQISAINPDGSARLSISTANGGTIVLDAPNVYISGNLLVGGSVPTLAIAPNAITNSVYAVRSQDFLVLTDQTYVEVISQYHAKEDPDSDIEFEYAIRFDSNNDIRGNMTLFKDGAAIPASDFYIEDNGGGNYRQVAHRWKIKITGQPVGGHTYALRFRRNGGAGIVYARSGSYFVIEETKR